VVGVETVTLQEHAAALAEFPALQRLIDLRGAGWIFGADMSQWIFGAISASTCDGGCSSAGLLLPLVAVVLGVLTMVFGLAWAVVAVVRAVARDRERQAVDKLKAAISSASRRRHAEPLPPACGRHWFPQGGGS
jgi:hypothetical protein